MFEGKLKDRELLTLKCATSPTTGKPADAEYSDGGKLYLVVPARGQRRWIFKFRWPNAAGKKETRRMGLGVLELVPVQRARELAFEARKLLHAGVNPMTAETRPGAAPVKKTAPTFLAFGQKIRDRAVHGIAEKSVARWDRGLNVYAKSLHDLPIDTITRHDVVACLEPIWLEIQVAAKKFQGQLYDIFKTAIAAEVYPEGKPNPADWEILEKLLAKQDHEETSHRSMPYKDLPAAWSRMLAIDSVASWTAQFTILTAVRTGEAIQARKDQIDADGIWHIPGKVMKNGKPANVPLSAEARALVAKAVAWQEYNGIADQTELLFPGSRFSDPQSENTVLFFLQKQVGIDATTHGCRSTFRSWGGDQDGIERDALEHCLHHIVGDGAEAAYNKAEQLEKRLRIFQAWADYATGKTAGRPTRRRADLKVVA